MTTPTPRLRGLLAVSCAALVLAAAPVRAEGDTTVENVVVKQAKRLLKEKNSPSAVTELGRAQIAAAGVGASPGTLLTQAPSVYAYQQGLGDNAPELTIRGVRGLEVAATLDGIPTQDLLAPGASSIADNLGGVFTTAQIDNVSIYPGVAYPDKNTFGTIGGTIAYESKRPAPDQYFDVTGTVGSFGTYREGFEYNSGAIDSPLGSGENAARFLLQYNNFQTQGFVDGTPARENEMLASFDKPYDDGLSKFQVTAIFNTADGLIQNEPVPLPYLTKNGNYSNYPTNLVFAKENNDWGTLIVKDTHTVNDYITAGLTAFFINNDQQTETYGAPQLLLPGEDVLLGQGQLTVNEAAPFINTPGGFGEGGLYGPPVGGQINPILPLTPQLPQLGIYNGGYGGYFYGKGNLYNPGQYYNNPKACPQSIINAYGGAGYSPCGLNDEITGLTTATYGIRPSVFITPPDIFGIANTIKLGGLAAKETAPAGYDYLGAFPNTPHDAANLADSLTGGTERTIYQAYIQDKIDVLENTLHLTPGFTLEGTKSSFLSAAVFCAQATESCAANAPAYGPNGAFGPNGYLGGGFGPVYGTLLDKYAPFKATKWDREALPFFNISYDFDKILPAAKGLTVYGSIGNSALFAPTSDFGPNSAGTPPYASIVHLYEGGVKYNVANLVLTADYFYQKVDRDFGYYSFQSGPLNGENEYSNYGQREFKGVEVNGTWQITPEWQVFGNVSHLLAKYLTSGFAFDTVAEDQYGLELKGDPVSGVPDWLGNFGVEYDHKSTLVDDDALHVRFSGRYTGHQYSTIDYTEQNWQTVPNFTGLAPLNFQGCGISAGNNPQNCDAYTRYNQVVGDTVTDTHGGGINPFVIFNLDVSYDLPTPQLPVIKKLSFDANIQNLFNHFYYQYFYKQISPAYCGNATSGPFYNPITGEGLALTNYSCGKEYADAIPGQPFSVFFSMTARF